MCPACDSDVTMVAGPSRGHRSTIYRCLRETCALRFTVTTLSAKYWVRSEFGQKARDTEAGGGE